ncbi:MAG: DUF1223 domain-containing protein [Alphaproteobacteria bacterium]|nr:DUF1223 domain-containing protein [Alphaproteobacteria bacterium]
MVGEGVSAYLVRMSFSARAVRSIIAGLVGVVLATVSPAMAGGKRPVVVELYTSQGSSSCPPADALLSELAGSEDVLALSFPITYWDMLGWKDTLGTETNTRRQKAYASVMGHGGVYTPQMIVDGVSDVVGNRDQKVWSVINARVADMAAVPVSINATPAEIRVSVGGAFDKIPRDATVWMFNIQSRAQVNVAAGENKGRQLTYRNVVRDIRALGMWKGQPLTIELPRREAIQTAQDAIAVVVQQNGYGRILGAAVISLQR